MPEHLVTSRYNRYLLPWVKPFPNFDIPFIVPVRRFAVQHLELGFGDRVLDIGCGIGGSFSHLVNAVGRQGEVVGVELSPATAEAAVKRVQSNGWENVKVIAGDAKSVNLAGSFDGLLMFGANEIFTSQAILDHVFASLKDGARVVIFGAKLVETGWGRILNPFLRFATKMSLPTTLTTDYFLGNRSRQLIEKRLEAFTIKEYAGGVMYIAWGKVRR